MKIPFITGEAPEGNYPINWFFMPEKINGKNALIGTPGMKEFSDFSNAAEVRGLHFFGVWLYTVCGNTVYRVDTVGNYISLGTIGTATGCVYMKDNGTQIMLIDKAKGYIITGTTLAEITDADFPIPAGLAYQDGYFIVIEKNTGNFFISNSYDGTAWDALDYSNAEGWPDNAIQILMDHRELWIFGPESIEVYYNSGASGFPFERVSGGFIERGIGAIDSAVKMDNSVLWLDDRFMVRRAEGYLPSVISPPKMNDIISKYSVKSDAIAYTYTDLGCHFYVLTFPTAGVTWVYNALTRFWHQWASGALQRRHVSNCHAFFNGKHIIGHMDNGKLLELDNEIYDDNGEIIKRTRQAPPVFNSDRNELFWHRLEIEFEEGVGLATGQGSDPQVMFDYSDDRGKTWSNEKWRSIGKIGEYRNRAIWRMLGSSRNRIPRISITDPVKANLIGANADISKGDS